MIARIKILFLLLVVAAVAAGSGLAIAQTGDPEWQEIAQGIDYRLYQLPHPNNVFVTRMDRNNPYTTVESSISQGSITDGRETVSGMYARYDQALNYWGGRENPPTWGMRNQVVVAINGAYFDLSEGIPQGGQIQSGWYAKPYDKLGGWGGFTWKLDRSAFISECLRNIPEDQYLTYPATGNIQHIDDVNDPPNDNELVIFTPQYNSRTGTSNSVVEVVVEMSSPTMVLPAPDYAVGVVRRIGMGEGNSIIPFNSIVISAVGSEMQPLLDNVQIGSEVQITQKISSYEYDCETPYSLNWTKTYSSIQGAFFYLKDGDIRDFSDAGAIRRNPRTAIAYNDEYIYFIVVDGRDPHHSVGMSIDELGRFTRDTLGAQWGVAQDGGGSSTMVIHGQVINNTYCNIYNCSYYYYYEPPKFIEANYTGQDIISADSNVVVSEAGIERPVANGMLMVVAQPDMYSHSFSAGDSVTAASDTYLRLGPGTNYDHFSVIIEGTRGRILDQFNNLSGVRAKSTYWWYVDFEGVVGWVVEGELIKQETPINFYPRK